MNQLKQDLTSKCEEEKLKCPDAYKCYTDLVELLNNITGKTTVQSLLACIRNQYSLERSMRVSDNPIL